MRDSAQVWFGLLSIALTAGCSDPPVAKSNGAGASTGNSGAAGSGSGGAGSGAGNGAGGASGSSSAGSSGANAGGSGGGTASGGAAGSGGTTTEPPPLPCATPLADRVEITNIEVSPAIEIEGSGINSLSLPVILSTSPNGRAKVAWSDGTNAHVTPLDEMGARLAPDITVPGSEVRGFVAHDQGSAILVVREDAMTFVLLDEAGSSQATVDIVGTEAHTVSGSRWIDDWPHQGRLAWSGSQYAAYFGQTGNHGAQGNHQGDHYAFISAAGAQENGGWDWGCSHSLDVRLAHNGTTFAPLCTSDTYPGAGIWFENDVEVSEEPSITNVGGVAKLGGLVPVSDGFLLTFTSPEDRASTDIVLIHVANDGTPSGRAYLTDTPEVDEGYAHLAAYGDAFLAGWDDGDEVSLVVVDRAGTVLEGPALSAARVGGQDDFATFANGDAGWAGAWDDLSQLRVVRVRSCD